MEFFLVINLVFSFQFSVFRNMYHFLFNIKKIKNIKNWVSFADSLRKIIINCSLTMIIAGACTLSGTIYEEEHNGVNGWEEPSALPKMSLILTKSGDVTLGISGMGSITIDWGDGSGVQTFDISSNVTYFTRSGSGLRTVTIAGANITRLECSNGQVTQINIAEISTLTHLFCSHNELTTIDVSNNTHLGFLLCNHNSITNLNVSANTTLSMLDISFNNMPTAALNALLTSLHSNDIANGKTIIINNNSGTASPQNINSATTKGWEIVNNEQ